MVTQKLLTYGFVVVAFISVALASEWDFSTGLAIFTGSTNVTGNVTAGEFFIGDGSMLTNINVTGINGTDSNETVRFNVLVATDCDAGDFFTGVADNGAPVCGTPTSSDTNETVRVENLVGTDCSAGNLIIGIGNDGTPVCAVDHSANITAGGPYLYDTGDVIYINGTELNLTIDDRAGDTNETTRFEALINTDCSAWRS